jgi:hypothetical protein
VNCRQVALQQHCLYTHYKEAFRVAFNCPHTHYKELFSAAGLPPKTLGAIQMLQDCLHNQLKGLLKWCRQCNILDA